MEATQAARDSQTDFVFSCDFCFNLLRWTFFGFMDWTVHSASVPSYFFGGVEQLDAECQK